MAERTAGNGIVTVIFYIMALGPHSPIKFDAFAKTHKVAKQKFRPTRLGVFSGAKAYIEYVEVLKKCRNAVGRTFCDAIKFRSAVHLAQRVLTLSQEVIGEKDASE
jgi:hypothetical protein